MKWDRKQDERQKTKSIYYVDSGPTPIAISHLIPNAGSISTGRIDFKNWYIWYDGKAFPGKYKRLKAAKLAAEILVLSTHHD